MNKKMIAFLLAAIFCLTLLSGCAEKKNNGKKENELEEAEFLDHLPEYDFEGENVVIACYDETVTTSIAAEENDGDTVNVALYESKQTVETRFNLTIEMISCSSTLQYLKQTIGTALTAGTSDYDILAGYQFYDIGLCLDGTLLDLNKLEGEANVIDVSQDYWASDVIGALNYGDSLYWIAGDISTQTLGMMFCAYCNTSLYNKYMLEKHGSIYDIVRNGDFTYDLLTEMCADIYQDVDSDQKVSENDIVGFASFWVSMVDGMLAGAGFKTVRTYDDGTLELYVENKDNQALARPMLEFKESAITFKVSYSTSADAEPCQMEQFAKGNTLFVVSKMSSSRLIREMTDDYGVIPCPKAAKDQPYRTAVHDAMPIFGINANSEHVTASAYVLEALCARNSQTVRPKYFDEALKYKYTRDNDSAEMIDLIHDSMTTDFGGAWSERLGNITHTFRDMTPGAMSSSINKYKNKWNEAFKVLIEKLREMQ